ncbi:unnamed protein product, partial [Mesorhabditis belari]|uniref:Uncharacterized protein n=1 Tax=Mesorhabditis belari TaxID=2138241 RepID=A0AAF3EKM3_9BILA
MLYFLALIPLTAANFGGLFGGGGCGCGLSLPPPPSLCLPPPPPMPCLPPPPPPCGCLPPIRLPSLCLPSLPSLPSPCGCGRKKRSASIVKSSTDSQCNSPLAEVILAKHLDTITDFTKMSEVTAPLHSELNGRTGGKWLVICGDNTQQPAVWRGEMSQFCSVTHKRTTCHAFQMD